MLISVTGPTNKPVARAAGFTLLEVMVVVAIVSVMLVAVRISLPDRAADALKFEAQRFVLTLNDCRDSAVLSGSPTGIRIAAGHYDLLRYHRGWQALARQGNDAPRVLPDEVELTVPPSRGGKVESGPAVVCLPSGETRMAAIALSHRRERGYYRFNDNVDGEFIATWTAAPAS
ncbi:MAG: GspH/FimT family pseudopilin [Gammaproteobacteria bacterium]|nr:GspH/FimT family pseudopilin [Gammaproteobacteria bacterium]